MISISIQPNDIKAGTVFLQFVRLTRLTLPHKACCVTRFGSPRQAYHVTRFGSQENHNLQPNLH